MKLNGCRILLVMLSLVVIACGGKYDEAENALNDYADVMEEYTASMEKADSADEVVKAINTYTEKMKTLAPKLQEINKKFPELGSEKDLPKELEKVSARIVELSQNVQSAMMKSMQHMMNPEVQKAIAAQSKAMAGMGQ